MAFIRSDIVFFGKHGEILRTLTENRIFSSGADGFVKSALLGLYHGKKSEAESSTDSKIEISRTYFDKRQNIEDLMFIFLQHEKLYQKKPLKVSEVFLYEDSVEDDNDNLIEEIKEYALYGLEMFAEKYQDMLTDPTPERVIEEIIDINLSTTEQLKNQVINDEQGLFYKTFDDKDINDEVNEIMSTYYGGWL